MLEDKNELRKIILKVTELFNADKDLELADLLRTPEITSEPTYHDNWNGELHIIRASRIFFLKALCFAKYFEYICIPNNFKILNYYQL